jgi:VanZ family protein
LWCSKTHEIFIVNHYNRFSTDRDFYSRIQHAADHRITGLDKLVHVFMFYVWSLSVQFDTSVKFRWNRILAIGTGFGLLTELIQLAAKNRSFDWYDWLFDSLGLMLAGLSGNLILPYLETFWLFRWLKNPKGN